MAIVIPVVADTEPASMEVADEDPVGARVSVGAAPDQTATVAEPGPRHEDASMLLRGRLDTAQVSKNSLGADERKCHARLPAPVAMDDHARRGSVTLEHPQSNRLDSQEQLVIGRNLLARYNQYRLVVELAELGSAFHFSDGIEMKRQLGLQETGAENHVRSVGKE